MDDAKTRRLAERSLKIVAELLERRIKDPRLGFVTVTEARLTNDLREAKVFYTVLGTPEEREDSAKALKSATGIIRSEVGRLIGLRHTPSLEFIEDALPENAQRIDELVAASQQKTTTGTRTTRTPDQVPGKQLATDRQDPWASGLVIVDKPGGMTSHDVVARIRRLAHTRRVGHAGTLDPMATGVLVIGVEKPTRLLGHLMLTEKTYAATMRLGQSTSTDDAEGEPTGMALRPATEVSAAALNAEIARLTGDIRQVPSSVS